jgi:diguanylate cyclase (GGDEF)-like protein/PAS domain S-box-containing protein
MTAILIVRNMSTRNTEKVQSLICQIVEAVGSTEDLNKLFPAIRHILGQVVDTTNFRIALYDRQNDTISLPYMVDQRDTYHRFVAGKTLTACVIKGNRPLLLNPVERERLVQTGAAEPVGHPAKAWLGVPLRVKQDVIGAVVVQSYTDSTLYTDDDKKLLELVSEHIGTAISRKQAQDKLRESEQRFRSLVENSHAGIAIIDDNYRFTYVNPELCRMSGYSEEESLGRDFRDFLAADSKKLVSERYLLRQQGKATPSRYEFSIVCKDGEKKWVEISSSVIEDSEGNLRTVAQLLDITERKRSEKELQESEIKFRTFFDRMPDALFLEDVDGKVIDANEAACELLGYNHEEIAKLSVDDLVTEGSPAFLPREIDEAEREGRPLETINKRKDGTPVPIELKGRIIRLGKQEVMLVSARNITERKKMEQEMESRRLYLEGVLAAVPDAVITLDSNYKITEWNAGAERLFGYASKEAIGRDIDKLISAPDMIEEAKKLSKLVVDGEHIPPAELVRYSKSGQRVSVIAAGAPLFVGDKFIGAVAAYTNITARVEAEEKLREASTKIERLHEIARQLAACSTEEEVYQITVEAAEKILTFSMCALSIREGDRLLVKAASTKIPPGTSRGKRLDEEGLDVKTYHTGETIVFGDISEVPEARPTREGFVKSGISAPIGNIGVFQVISTKPNAFTKEHARLLELLLGHTAEAVKRIRLQVALKEQAIRDALTGLYNRHFFNERIREEVERSKRYNHSIAFIMVDINWFKEINDRFGHLQGDRVLKAVATVVKDAVRETDFVIRYGGDEFLIVLPETNGESDIVIERIHRELARRNKEKPIIEFPVTLAVGTSHCKPGCTRAWEEILSEADLQMYQDKKIHRTKD